MTDASSPTSELTFPKADSVDVLLLLEGTFPYVAGGVSSWVDQIIRGFPHIRFGAIFLGSQAKDYGKPRFALPPNLVHLDVTYLVEHKENPPIRTVHASRGIMEKVAHMHHLFEVDVKDPECARNFGELVKEAHPKGKLPHEAFLYSPEAWDLIKRSYRHHSTDPSFVDYFWTVRTIHTPFWRLQEVAMRSPKAKLLHSVSTGYAGILGVMLKQLQDCAYLLSEHGIYVKERKIDLYQAQWIKDNRGVFEHDPSRVSYFRQLWIRFFEHLGYITYQAADDITALYEANRVRQVEDGAPAERTQNIPNGVDILRFGALRELRPKEIPPVMCLIGRVVPIKDVKTYIRSVSTVAEQRPDIEAWIAGPETEDPTYAQECHDLVDQLGLQGKVKFLGFQKLTELLPKVGLVVLSSISEALPLVMLEGYAAGVPSLATDVGSCHQLVYGLPGEDADIGSSGRVVRIADPQALALAALELFNDPAEWHRAAQAGIRRVEKYYAQEMMFSSFGQLYDKYVKD